MIKLIVYGLKNGHPTNLDLKIGVTELRNPHRIRKLQELTGFDEAVKLDVRSAPNYQECLRKWVERIHKAHVKHLIDCHQCGGEHTQMTVGVHCLAGRHRSVVVAQDLAAALSGKHNVSIEYRDVRK